MSVPKYVKGTYFDVAVSLDGGTTYTPLCGLNSRNFTHVIQANDDYIRDCGDPTSIPARVVNVTGESFDIAGTGVYNRAQGPLIRSLPGKSLPYRFILGEDANDSVDSGYYQGNFVNTNQQIQAPEGNVTAQFTFQSDGPIVFVPGADIIVLDPIAVSPATVVHGASYSGTIANKTAGSTITATSSDGTTLTVSGTTLTGTFANAGQAIVTLTETLATAPNSPKTSRVAINVT